jgi:hypothetical protein
MNESHFVYIDNDVSVRMLSGPFLSSIPLVVREICPANQDFLLLPDLMSEIKDQEQGFASTLTLQYAWFDSGIEQLKPKCLEYIKNISRCPFHILLNMTGNTSKVIWRSLEAVWNYLRASPIARQASPSSCLVKTQQANW